MTGPACVAVINEIRRPAHAPSASCILRNTGQGSPGQRLAVGIGDPIGVRA